MNIYYNLYRFYKSLSRTLSGSKFSSIPIVLKIGTKVFRFIIQRTYVDVQGHKMYVDKNDTLGLAFHGEYLGERFETSLIKQNIKKGSVVLDIGAQVGFYSLIIADLVGKEGKVIAFEPELSNYNKLRNNIDMNGYRNVIPINKALSDKNQNIKIYLSPINLGDHRIYDSGDGRKAVEIECIRFDDHFNVYCDKIDFIKMDIQGSEYSALLGMKNVLNNKKKLKIISEFWPGGIRKSGHNPEEYLKYMNDLGFNCYEIIEEENKLIKADLTSLLNSTDEDAQTNLFFSKENEI